MAELITQTGVPYWLQPEKRDSAPFYTERVWEDILDGIAAGQTLTSLCNKPNTPEYNQMLKWVHSDPNRKERYYLAREIGAEKIEDGMLNIADGKDANGEPTMDDVQRSTLRISTRKWLLGVWNRKRYGETKQVDVKVEVDISEAMKLANERVTGRLIEGEVMK